MYVNRFYDEIPMYSDINTLQNVLKWLGEMARNGLQDGMISIC